MAEASGATMDPEAEEGFRGPQVCNIVGITYRQLDYWARTKLCRPSLQDASGSGSQRLYSFEDLVELKLVKRLLDAGVSLQKVRSAIEHLRSSGEDLSGVTLASDGTSIFACRSQNDFIDLLKGGQGVFGIAIQPVYDEVKASVSRLQPRGPDSEPVPTETPSDKRPVSEQAGTGGE